MAANPYHQIEAYRAGDVITRRGDEGRELYVVHSGRVLLSWDDGADGTIQEVRERGEFFGELSLFQGVSRRETATAVGPTKLLVLEPGGLLLKIRRDPTFAFALLQRLSRQIVELEEARAAQASAPQEPRADPPSLRITRQADGGTLARAVARRRSPEHGASA